MKIARRHCFRSATAREVPEEGNSGALLLAVTLEDNWQFLRVNHRLYIPTALLLRTNPGAMNTYGHEDSHVSLHRALHTTASNSTGEWINKTSIQSVDAVSQHRE